MNEVVELEECRDEVHGGKYPSRFRVGNSNGGGGGMEGVLKRLDAVESTVSEIRSQVDGIAATLPHLATKDDVTAVRVEVSNVRAEVGGIAAILPHLAIKADLSAAIGGVRADLSTAIGALRTELSTATGALRTDLSAATGALRTDLSAAIGGLRAELSTATASVMDAIRASEVATIKWTIGIIIAVAGLAFTIGKYGH